MPDKVMARTTKKQRLEKLQQKKKQLSHQIQQLQAQETQSKRREDTRRKVLVGAAVYAMIANHIDGWSEQKMLRMMDGFLTRPNERALFGLPPTDAAGESIVSDKSSSNMTTAPSIAPNITTNTTFAVHGVSSNEDTKLKRRRPLKEVEQDLEKEFNL